LTNKTLNIEKEKADIYNGVVSKNEQQRKGMIRMKKNRGKKKNQLRYMIALVLVLVVAMVGYFGDFSFAAEEVYISYNGQILDPASTIEMKTSSMQLMLQTEGTTYDDDELYQVDWTIEDTAQRDVIASISKGTSQTIGIVRAISPGDVTVTVTIRDKTSTDLAVIGSATCNIRVVFSIDTTTDDSIYKFVNETDTDRSLVLYSDSDPVQLGLNFGAADSTNTQWQSSNEEIVSVTQNGGVVTPVGAGKTQVTATYTPTGESTTYTAYLDVYVLPKVSQTDGSGYTTALDVNMPSGNYLYTDTNFTKNTEVIRSKVIWVVKKDDGNGNSVVIADSLGLESDLIKLTPSASRSNELKVEGLAGEYDIYFYAYGTYNSALEKGTLAYDPTVVHLTLQSTIADGIEETICIGDSYNFAEAFNMTQEDFQACFTVGLRMTGGGDIANYLTYTDANSTMKALAEGKVEATLAVKEGKENYVKSLIGLDKDDSLPNGGAFFTYINIMDTIQLDRSSITIAVGQTYQLSVLLNGTYSGPITWQTSDKNYVTVENGLITGKKITEKDVTVTATIDAGNGVYRTATCTVKVEATVEDFKLNPDKEQRLLVGEHLTVVANIKQTVSVAPLEWISSNEDVFVVETSADGKSGVITAVGGGEADLLVYNTINEEYQVLHIVVRVPINSIQFANPEVSIGLYKEGYNLKNDVSYTPNNATDKELTWASSDTSVVTVDSDGYMTLVGAGTALVSVFPTYNPHNVMSSCIVTVIGTPDSMTISETDVTLNVGDSKTLTIDFLPKNTITGMKWTPDKEGIVEIAYDEDRQLATLVGKGPGSTNVNIVTTNGLITNIKVTVKQPSTESTLKPTEVIVRTGEKVQLNPTLKPTNSTDTLQWKSYNTAIAKVDELGQVEGVKSGTTFVQVTAYNGKIAGPTAVVQITVRDGVTGILLDSVEKTIEVDQSITLTPIFVPDTAYEKGVTWTVANTSIAKIEASGVSNAKITGVAPGTTLVTGVTVDGGYMVACMIHVKPKSVENDTKVTVSPTSKFLKIGKTFYVKATVTGTSNKKVTWKSSNKKVCTVTKNGKVKGKKIGTAYITATAKDGSGAFDRCKVRVVRKVTKVKLNKYSMTVLVGSSKKLKATVKPKNATIKKVKWTTSDATIATVSTSGRVIGVAEGIVKIKAKAQDGSGKSATCLVKVMEPVDATGVSVQNSEITVAKGRAVQSGIVAVPANTTTKIKYYSDNKKVATVDSKGKIRTKRVGQATIYGETANGMIGYCDVLVVDLNRKGVVMRVYDTEQLRVNEIDEGVTWYSKDINIATVDSNGLVTGRKKGTTIIYAIVNGVKLGCKVTIKKIK